MRELIYISYSHKDKKWHRRLRQILDADPNVRDRIWDDTKIPTSSNFWRQIAEHVARARVMIMIGSPEFFASDSGAFKSEIEPALAAHEADELAILWFPVRGESYRSYPVAHIMAATGVGARPLESLSPAEQEAALLKVYHEVLRYIPSGNFVAVPPVLGKRPPALPPPLDQHIGKEHVADGNQAKPVFISYAHKDNESAEPAKRWLDRLKEHLEPLVQQDQITVCSDQQIDLGDDWHAHIQTHLNGARAAVLLVSPAFLASEYIRNNELPVLLRHAKESGVRIIPVILRPCLFEETRFKHPDPKIGPEQFTLASLQASGSPAKALSEMSEGEQDRALLKVAQKLAKLVTGGESSVASVPEGATSNSPPAPRKPLTRTKPSAGTTLASPSVPQENRTMKITLLFLAANPDGVTPLALAEEVRSIRAKIRAADHREFLEFKTEWAVRPDDLLQYLNEHRPHMVHFSGHGSPVEQLIFHSENGRAKPVSKAALRHLFATLKDNIRLVVLNACYSRSQAEAIVEVIDFAVGMTKAIGDEAAIAFAASFYRALGFGRSVQEAFDQGRAALLLEGIAEEDTPELLVRKGVDPARVVLLGPGANPA